MTTDQDDLRLPGQWRQGAHDPPNFLTAQRRRGRLHPDLRPNVEKRSGRYARRQRTRRRPRSLSSPQRPIARPLRRRRDPQLQARSGGPRRSRRRGSSGVTAGPPGDPSKIRAHARSRMASVGSISSTVLTAGAGRRFGGRKKLALAPPTLARAIRSHRSRSGDPNARRNHSRRGDGGSRRRDHVC